MLWCGLSLLRAQRGRVWKVGEARAGLTTKEMTALCPGKLSVHNFLILSMHILYFVKR